jgi:hypothetical protein
MSRLSCLVGTAALFALPLSAPAQEAPVEGPSAGDGANLIEEGTRLLLEGFSDELRPLMEGLATEMEPRLRDFAEQVRPMLEEFADTIGDLDQYHAPERLPNGDILLRRKTPLEVPEGEARESDDAGEVEL